MIKINTVCDSSIDECDERIHPSIAITIPPSSRIFAMTRFIRCLISFIYISCKDFATIFIKKKDEKFLNMLKIHRN